MATTEHDFTVNPLPFSTLAVTRIRVEWPEGEPPDDGGEAAVARAAARLLGRPVYVEFVDADDAGEIWHAHAAAVA